MGSGIRENNSMNGITTRVVLSANELGPNVDDVVIKAVKIAVDGIKKITGDTLSATKNSVVEKLVYTQKLEMRHSVLLKQLSAKV